MKIIIIGLLIIALLLFGCIQESAIDCGVITNDSNSFTPQICFTNLLQKCAPGSVKSVSENYSNEYVIHGTQDGNCQLSIYSYFGTTQIVDANCLIPKEKIFEFYQNPDFYYCDVNIDQNSYDNLVEKFAQQNNANITGMDGFKVYHSKIYNYKADENLAKFTIDFVYEDYDYAGINNMVSKHIRFLKPGKECKAAIIRTSGDVRLEPIIKLKTDHSNSISGLIWGDGCGIISEDYNYNINIMLVNYNTNNFMRNVEGTITGTYIELDNNNYAYFDNKSFVYQQEKDYNKALEFSKKAFDYFPNYSTIDDIISIINDSKNYDFCIEFIPKAIEKFPTRISPYRQLGYCYRELNRLEESRESYQKAIEINDSDHYSWKGIAITYYLEHNFKKAHKIVDQGIAINSYSSELYAYKGVLYYYQGFYDKCIEWMNKALEINPSHSYAQEYKEYCSNQ